jgi:hypothetical protein
MRGRGKKYRSEVRRLLLEDAPIDGLTNAEVKSRRLRQTGCCKWVVVDRKEGIVADEQVF